MKTVIIVLSLIVFVLGFVLLMTRDKKETKVNGGGGAGDPKPGNENQTT